ncbi:MAG TPA: matrixin family metalloprotease [Candidatus Eisenbacteria bacterium]|jgi:hypothetical protein
MKSTVVRVLALVVTGAATLGVADAYAFRMIQNTAAGRTSFGSRVACDDPGGFAHWTNSSISWSYNPANQGGKAGVATALQNGMAAWTLVTPATYTLTYSGTTGAGFVTDGRNTVVWADGNGCTGGCLAITALVLASGQVITEADISFNNSANWNTDGSDYDVEAIAAHELGHTLGIHHTELQRRNGRPTMYASYFGTAGRSLESDDRDALNCAYTRYPSPGSNPLTAVNPIVTRGGERRITLAARPRLGGSVLRFALPSGGPVRLDVFDVAGRKVTRLVDGFEAAGEHEVAWDGAASYGRAPSGFYFARMITSEGRVTATVPLAE